jgi:hypothetical protein
MFDVGLIVLREVVVYIRRESGAARGLGEEGELEEVNARPIAPAQWVNPINNRDSIASAANVTEAPPAIETIERRQQRKSRCSERHAISQTGQQGSAPMLSRLFTIVLLAVASLRVNAASLTGVIITNEATSVASLN